MRYTQVFLHSILGPTCTVHIHIIECACEDHLGIPTQYLGKAVKSCLMLVYYGNTRNIDGKSGHECYFHSDVYAVIVW